MASITNIKTDITTLNDYQLQELFNYIGEMLSFGSIKSTLNEEFKESRFSKGEVCPHCQSTSVVKNGKLNGKQRYICKSCKKSFNIFPLLQFLILIKNISSKKQDKNIIEKI